MKPRTATVVDGRFFSALAEPTRFYFVRHGQSEGNAAKVFQGRLDLPLDDKGREQAREAGAWFSGRGIDLVVSSPYTRAAETARIIAASCALPAPQVEDLVREIDIGIFTGLHVDLARDKYPEVWTEFESRSWDAVPEAETSIQLYERALEAWALLAERASSGSRSIVCVTHGGFIQWLVRSTFGCTTWMPLVTTTNCGIFELAVEPRGGRDAYVQWKRLDFRAGPGNSTVPPVF